MSGGWDMDAGSAHGQMEGQVGTLSPRLVQRGAKGVLSMLALLVPLSLLYVGLHSWTGSVLKLPQMVGSRHDYTWSLCVGIIPMLIFARPARPIHWGLMVVTAGIYLAVGILFWWRGILGLSPGEELDLPTGMSLVAVAHTASLTGFITIHRAFGDRSPWRSELNFRRGVQPTYPEHIRSSTGNFWLASLLGLAGMMGGIALGGILADFLALKETYGQDAFMQESQPFALLPLFAVVAGAEPRGTRQLVLFFLCVTIVTAWIQLAGPMAVLARQFASPDLANFASWSAFILLAAPVALLCLAVMKQAGALARDGARAKMPQWLVLLLPGIALTGLFLDYVGGAWHIGGKAEPEDWQLGFAIFTAGIVCFWGARPGSLGHRGILATTAALAMMLGVSVQSAMFGYLDASFIHEFPKLTVIPAILTIQFLVVRIAKTITGARGPWGDRHEEGTTYDE